MTLLLLEDVSRIGWLCMRGVDMLGWYLVPMLIVICLYACTIVFRLSIKRSSRKEKEEKRHREEEERRRRATEQANRKIEGVTEG